MCVTDNNGNFTPQTVTAAVELVAKLLKDNRLSLDDIGTHNLVVGWKDCPRLWTKYPDKFDKFKENVRRLLKA
jgi:N-acetylmuramoyl-L-alanine amidase